MIWSCSQTWRQLKAYVNLKNVNRKKQRHGIDWITKEIESQINYRKKDDAPISGREGQSYFYIEGYFYIIFY